VEQNYFFFDEICASDKISFLIDRLSETETIESLALYTGDLIVIQPENLPSKFDIFCREYFKIPDENPIIPLPLPTNQPFIESKPSTADVSPIHKAADEIATNVLKTIQRDETDMEVISKQFTELKEQLSALELNYTANEDKTEVRSYSETLIFRKMNEVCDKVLTSIYTQADSKETIKEKKKLLENFEELKQFSDKNKLDYFTLQGRQEMIDTLNTVINSAWDNLVSSIVAFKKSFSEMPETEFKDKLKSLKEELLLFQKLKYSDDPLFSPVAIQRGQLEEIQENRQTK